MPIKQDIDSLSERSHEVQDILGRNPIWVIRWGISVIFIIILSLLILSFFISYNSVIKTDIVVTSENPPIDLKVKSTGELTDVFVKMGEQVKSDQILAIIRNTADRNDVYYLIETLDKCGLSILSIDILYSIYPPHLQLGEVQLSYGEFITQYQNFLLYETYSPDKREAQFLLDQLNSQKILLRNQYRQLEILKSDLALTNINYDRNKALLEKGVIAKLELERIDKQRLLEMERIEDFQASIANTRVNISNSLNLITKSQIKNKELDNNNKNQLERAYKILKNEILTWEELYVIKSPVDGFVTFFDTWRKYQNVSTGDILFTVIPEQLDGIIGRVSIPIQNSGKVKEGQNVLIKLHNFPFKEYGGLNGIITSISEVPKQGDEFVYIANVEINSLKTTFGKEIDFKQEMRGTAEIILEKLSILERIFYGLRNVMQ